jgi:hypothetical protein
MNLSCQPGEIRVKNASKSHYDFLTLRFHMSPNLSGICGGIIILEGDSVFCCRLLWFQPPPPPPTITAEAESKEKHGVWEPMSEFTITSSYVHSTLQMMAGENPI